MAWHTYIKYWEVCAKLNTCLLKAYVFAVQTATRASQATCSWQKPKTQQKTLKGVFPQGNSALLPIAQCGHFCKLNVFWSFSIYVKNLCPQHRPSLCPFLVCFLLFSIGTANFIHFIVALAFVTLTRPKAFIERPG